ncbi:hypothetical protein ACIRD2_02535 [Streptomyces sp. NPDC093595]|uniref:Uncharacterized protein n=1 Tax=Streptomyces venezuelae TaxID=54571 RepID=A0A5P2BFC9_STRVZ|nr:hypothetical protein [Streptomyces venezuelae]QES29212.1 hypothetical protein DEJ47_24755 [Streptomyces venezuelae]
MRLTPRKEEVEAVKALLEDPDFSSADQMAKAVIKQVADILQMRDWVALVHTWSDGSRGLNWAPFGNEAEAKSFASKLAIGGTGRLVKLNSPGVTLANIDGKKGWKGYCQHPECGHAPFTHSAASAARGACQIPTCPCSRFEK